MADFPNLDKLVKKKGDDRRIVIFLALHILMLMNPYGWVVPNIITVQGGTTINTRNYFAFSQFRRLGAWLPPDIFGPRGLDERLAKETANNYYWKMLKIALVQFGWQIVKKSNYTILEYPRSD